MREVTRSHNVDVIYAYADDDTQVAVRITVPSLAVVPNTGDLTSFGDSDDATVYRVVSRWFTWRSETDLQIQLLLAHVHPSSVRSGTADDGVKRSWDILRDPLQRKRSAPLMKNSEQLF